MKRKKPDYELKARVIEMGLCDLQASVSKAQFQYSEGLLDDRQYFELTISLSNAYDVGLVEEWHEAEKINHATYERRNRLKCRIMYMVEHYPCLFLTLTFEDSVLNSTTAATRRQYVKKFLAEFDTLAIANIDFGKTNGREHYHAVLAMERINLNSWPYGFIYAETVRNKTTNFRKLSTYIAKLTNHAIKETTKRQPLMYVGWRKLKKQQPDLDI